MQLKAPRLPYWWASNPKIPETPLDDTPESEAMMDDLYVARQRTIRSVDDLVGSLVSELEDLGVLDHTYVIYTSDNGCVRDGG